MNSIIYDNVKLGKNVSIEDFTIIGKPPIDKKDGELETTIGDDSIIRSFSVIYAGNKIGARFKTGHKVVIRENNEIGNDVSVGINSEIAFNVKIGNNVKIHSSVHVFENTIIEDDCRINPGVYFLNSKYPYSPGEKGRLKGSTIKKGAIIAARSIIMPGVTVGNYSLVGAGSLVTKDVPPFKVVIGRPARVIKDIREIKSQDGKAVYNVPGD
ncbi:MAG: transferase [Candidatus Aenigmarchaeota archaeon]|nr:transferase [Candidatus Aenigmarchaeota archaeon]